MSGRSRALEARTGVAYQRRDIAGLELLEEAAVTPDGGRFDLKCDAPPSIGVARLLDGCVARAHRVQLFGHRYHPYHIATDAGTLAILAFSAWFGARQQGVGFAGFVVAFAAAQGIYALVRHLRYRLTGIAARSFLQDSVLVVLPGFAVASVLVGNDLAASLDLAGLDLALGLAFIRVGCFLGGCCYGRPARWGVRYTPPQLLTLRGWRSYTSGPPPPGRVVPLQVFEAIVNLLLFATLLTWRMQAPAAQGHVLAAFLLAYGIWRFGSDFWRAASIRPRRAGLSEAQWTSAAVAALAGGALML